MKQVTVFAAVPVIKPRTDVRCLTDLSRLSRLEVGLRCTFEGMDGLSLSLPGRLVLPQQKCSQMNPGTTVGGGI